MLWHNAFVHCKRIVVRIDLIKCKSGSLAYASSNKAGSIGKATRLILRKGKLEMQSPVRPRESMRENASLSNGTNPHG